MAVFDTNLLINYLHGDKKAIETVGMYSKIGRLSITCINKYELMRGATLAGEMLLDELLSNFNVLYLDNSSIAIASNIYKKLRSNGKIIDDADILIASIAIANDEILITSDKDFEHINSKLIKVVS
jgi:predicted nucleic acid-binding protein